MALLQSANWTFGAQLFDEGTPPFGAHQLKPGQRRAGGVWFLFALPVGRTQLTAKAIPGIDAEGTRFQRALDLP
jgi:hypothetical protein